MLTPQISAYLLALGFVEHETGSFQANLSPRIIVGVDFFDNHAEVVSIEGTQLMGTYKAESLQGLRHEFGELDLQYCYRPGYVGFSASIDSPVPAC